MVTDSTQSIFNIINIIGNVNYCELRRIYNIDTFNKFCDEIYQTYLAQASLTEANVWTPLSV